MLLWFTTGFVGVNAYKLDFIVDNLVDKFGFKKISYDKCSTDSIDIDGTTNVDTNYKFTNFNDFLNFVTKNYKENFIVSDIHTRDDLTMIKKRPSFVHLHIDIPIGIRFQLFQTAAAAAVVERCTVKDSTLESITSLDLKDTDKHSIFFEKDYEYQRDREIPLLQQNDILIKFVPDHYTYLETGIHTQLQRFSKQFCQYLFQSHLFNVSHPASPLRPSWDKYFMKLANLASSRSNCMKRKVGCCIVQDSRIIATGYNGTPRFLTNCFDGGCERCNSGDSQNLSCCKCLHAEENALLEAGRSRIAEKNCILYCDTCPCITCSIKIVQTGIHEVVYSQSYNMDEQSFQILSQGNVKVRQYKHPYSDKLIIKITESSFEECS